MFKIYILKNIFLALMISNFIIYIVLAFSNIGILKNDTGQYLAYSKYVPKESSQGYCLDKEKAFRNLDRYSAMYWECLMTNDTFKNLIKIKCADLHMCHSYSAKRIWMYFIERKAANGDVESSKYKKQEFYNFIQRNAEEFYQIIYRLSQIYNFSDNLTSKTIKDYLKQYSQLIESHSLEELPSLRNNLKNILSRLDIEIESNKIYINSSSTGQVCYVKKSFQNFLYDQYKIDSNKCEQKIIECIDYTFYFIINGAILLLLLFLSVKFWTNIISFFSELCSIKKKQ